MFTRNLFYRALAPLLIVIVLAASLTPVWVGAQSTWGDLGNSGVENPKGPFPDVLASHPFVKAIQYLKDNQIVQGYPDGTWGGKNRINRAEFLKIIVASNNPQALESYTKESCFWDVPKGEWYTPYVCYAKAHGIVSGYPDGSFRPEWNINFAEAAKIVGNTFLLIPSGGGLTDPWFKRFVEALGSVKSIPLSITTFDQRVTRDDMAEIMYRIRAKDVSHASRTYAEMNGEGLVRVASCQELLERTQLSQLPLMKDGVMPVAQPAPAPSRGEGGGGGAFPFTPTNVQVAGVDEGDIVKTDGAYIYIAKADTVRIVKAVPPAELKEVATVKLPLDQSKGEYFYVTELYAHDNELVVIGNFNMAMIQPLEPSPVDAPASRIMPPWRSNNVNRVLVFDTSNKATPKLVRSVSIQGNSFTSRRIGDTLYLVTNVWNGVYWGYPGATVSGASIVDASATIGDVVPTITDSADGSTKPVVNCQDVILFPKIASSNYLTVSAIPLSDLGKPVTSSMMVADGSATYVSANNLYLSSTNWSVAEPQSSSSAQTTIYKLALTNGPTFIGSGEVPGTILNQWSMDEYDNNLRIATTKHSYDATGQQHSASNVYVLNSQMRLIGRTRDLAPGEQTYAVLFSGKRGIVATYRQIDPLFTIDLSNPSNPLVQGALKVPGQPQFIQAWDDNHIISFGIAEAATSQPDSSGMILPRPVTGGVKMSLFDVSNLEDVKEVQHVVIGMSGTSSEALYNHKAIMVDKENSLLAFPIMESGTGSTVSPDQCATYSYDQCPMDKCQKICVPSSCTTENGVQICTPDCGGAGSCRSWNVFIEPFPVSYNQPIFQGAYVYHVSPASGFTLKSKITHFSEADRDATTGQIQWWGNKAISRILRIGETLYTVSLGMVKAHSLSDYAEIKSAVIVGE